MLPAPEASAGGSTSANASARAIFVFPSAAGHVNPSLPLARGLVARGWAVDYLAIAQFREAIEDTGATFHDRDGVCREQGIEDVTAMVLATAKDYGDPPPQWWLNLGSISTAQLLPVYIEWFRSRCAQLVVYCPVLCQVARFAAAQLRIPAVSLLTTAGPGYFDAAIAGMAGAAAVRGVAAGLVAEVGANEANARAIESLRSQLPAMPELTLNSTEPLCCDYYAAVNLVSTTEELADPMCAADTEYFRAAGKSFAFVGPLLDEAGAARSQPGQTDREQQQELLRRVEAAVAGGQRIVYVSMGTVITSDHAEHGWGGSSGSGISGQQLCQSVYRAVFAELGAAPGDGQEDGQEDAPPLIVVSLGPQPDALAGVAVPSNAVCAAAVAQVELLRVGKPVLFVTNGGQNSLMESMTAGTPVLVCPGFGDQTSNAAKVEANGWGAKVSRPPAPTADDMPAADPVTPAAAAATAEVVAAYQAAVQRGVREVMGRKEFAQQAQLIAAGLAKAEGVDGALRILTEAAAANAATADNA